MIATTREQGERLGKLLNAEDTADFYYDSHGILEWRGDPVLFMIGSFQTPAWSLSALWDIVHNLDKTYDFDTKMSSEELMELLVKTIEFRFKNRTSG